MKILGGLLVLAALNVFCWILFASGSKLQCDGVPDQQAELVKAEKALQTAKAQGKSQVEITSLEREAYDAGLNLHLRQTGCDSARRVDVIGYVLGSVLGIAGIIMLVKSRRKDMRVQKTLGIILVLAALNLFVWVFFASYTSTFCDFAVEWAKESLEKAEKSLETAKAQGESLNEITRLESNIETSRKRLISDQAQCDSARTVDRIGYAFVILLGVVGTLMLVKSGRKKTIP